MVVGMYRILKNHLKLMYICFRYFGQGAEIN